VIASPLTVVASPSAVTFTSDSSNFTGSDMQAYTNGLTLLALPVAAMYVLVIAFRRSRDFRPHKGMVPSKPTSVRWLSLESYLNAITKGKKRLRLWLS